MNIERITQLRDFIAQLPEERVQMEGFIFSLDEDVSDDVYDDLFLHGAKVALDRHPCGAVACIAGWATYLFDPEATTPSLSNAMDALDLTDEQREELFTPPHWDEPGRYTKADVVRTLTRLIETGEVQWD